MAEGLLRNRLEARGLDVAVSSAGLAFDGRPATVEAVEAAAAYGVDISGHRSRVLDAAMLREADLVIAMERMHAREAFALDDQVLPRCFTLKDLVRRGRQTGPRGADEPLPSWLRRVGASRRRIELIGHSPDDDVADPYLSPRDVYERCIAELDGLVSQLVDLAWPRHTGTNEVVA